MKKATNINELANNLIPENFLTTKDKDVYVPVYDHILETLRDMVINDQVESQAFFVAGQQGTGKTTALNFLYTEELGKHFHVKYIYMRDYLDRSDADIVDFLLAFAFSLVENSPLAENYYKKLVDIQKKHEGEILESVEKVSERKSNTGVNGEITVGGGFLNFVKLKAGFFSSLKLDSNYRKASREVFKLKKPFLGKLVNEVIEAYIEKVTKGKKLLVIVDDLDKLTEVPQINSIFIENRNYIFSLACKKIISIPTYLTKAPEIFNYCQYPIRQFVLRLTSNPFRKKMSPPEKKKIEMNKQLLRDVIRKRIEKDCSLIDDDALERAINYSGGIIRQLIRIVYIAAVQVRVMKREKITLKDVNEAIELLRNQLAGTITSTEKVKLLDMILKKNIPVSEMSEQFIQLLQSSNVLSYENGKPWYEVNPIISDTVRVYAERQEE
jgi:DNA polymerase III delta prime subunit